MCHIPNASGVVTDSSDDRCIAGHGICDAMCEGPQDTVNLAAISQQSTRPADDALMDNIRSGDHAAFEELFNRYYAQVYGLSLRVLGTPEDAEELTLDVFMKLYEQPLDRVDDGSLGGWLHRTALNRSFNVLRSRKRRLGWLRRSALLSRDDNRQPENPAEVVERASDVATVRNALAQLPERQRNVLVLRSHGFSYQEIAQAEGIAPSSVGTTLARAEKALRKLIEQEGIRS